MKCIYTLGHVIKSVFAAPEVFNADPLLLWDGSTAFSGAALVFANSELWADCIGVEIVTNYGANRWYKVQSGTAASFIFGSGSSVINFISATVSATDDGIGITKNAAMYINTTKVGASSIAPTILSVRAIVR